MNDSNITFTVIIPTHDRDDLLAYAIESAVGQVLQPVEIIIVGDARSDKTKEMVSSLSDRYSEQLSIYYIENELGGGALLSRNLAANHAQGSHLAFLDDDDYWDKGYLEKIKEILNEYTSDIIVTQYSCVDKNNVIVADGKSLPIEYKECDLYLRNPGILCSNIVIEKGMFYSVGGYDSSIFGSADKDLLIQVKSNNGKHHFCKEKLVFWRTGHSCQWSMDAARILPGVRRFYVKYFFRMNPYYQVKMILKIMRLTVASLKQ